MRSVPEAPPFDDAMMLASNAPFVSMANALPASTGRPNAGIASTTSARRKERDERNHPAIEAPLLCTYHLVCMMESQRPACELEQSRTFTDKIRIDEPNPDLRSPERCRGGALS